MRLSRGDVILREGKFALVWDAPATNLVQTFPIEDAGDGFAVIDAVMTGWNEHGSPPGIRNPVICLSKASIGSDYGCVRMPDLALGAGAIEEIHGRLHHFVMACGVHTEWPIDGQPRMAAPVFAN